MNCLDDSFEVVQPSHPHQSSEPVASASTAERLADTSIEIRDLHGGGIFTEVLIDALSELSPAQADRLFRPRVELLLRLQSHPVMLVLAPWLSSRTRATLDELAVNYLDLTGNARLDIRRPRVMLKLDGAPKNPGPGPATGSWSLAGPRAGRLVRWLVDRPPPYRVTELAENTTLSAGYVSRLIEVISDLGLLQRRGRVVSDVDWVGLLRERAATTSLFRANHAVTMLAPLGPQSVLERLLADGELSDPVALTGSAAADAVAPLTAGGQLMLYVPTDLRGSRLTDSLGLLPTADSANVVLLTPFDPIVFDRRRKVGGLWHVALSQLAMDCLSGPDRLPAAGEAVLRQMIDSESLWRNTDTTGGARRGSTARGTLGREHHRSCPARSARCDRRPPQPRRRRHRRRRPGDLPAGRTSKPPIAVFVHLGRRSRA